jgi:hypothetical protein
MHCDCLNSTYSLGAAIWVALGSTDAQHVGGATVSTEEAAVVEAVGVDATNERLVGPQGELHAVLVAHLAHCNHQEMASVYSFDFHKQRFSYRPDIRIQHVRRSVRRSRILQSDQRT